jgi:hypothetical protein
MRLPSPSPLAHVPDADPDERAIREIISPHREWFMSIDGRTPLSINTDEFDFSVAHRRLMFSCWTEGGSRTWHVIGWKWIGDKLVLQATRRMGSESATIELIARASAKAIVASIAAARQERCERLAQLVAQSLEGVGGRVLGVGSADQAHRPGVNASCSNNPQENVSAHFPDDQHPKLQNQPAVKIERAALSPRMRKDQPGRYARIILRLPHERSAFTGTVAHSDVRNVDALFSSALLWFQRITQTPKRPHTERLWIVVERQILDAARQRHVLLRDSLRERIELLEIDDDWKQVTPVPPFQRKHLWRKRLTHFPPVSEIEPSEQTREIVARAPQAIDIVASHHGHTLRFHGLPFARVRRLMEQDRIWFGIEGSQRRLLNDFHRRDWLKLLIDLENYRSEVCRDRRHWLYRASGEAWLESILRRNITKLDPGLIIAPLHAQFRTSHGGPTGARPIDLLALRHDGRLVVIELKVTEDREHVFQGVDYWRRVEAHRRRGHISFAKLFGDREISDESPLVYLVAPTLRFHPSFHTLARTIAPDIEIYRFDVNEDWRSGVRVVRRERVNA